ncbi:MAG: type VI secretion system contractile sheath small subunit [Desulfatitalea sp.]|nr:type VI secretion system contractile sheath small subunit [Desulfatitalea sp.]NNK00537.1 type VI secretion system contractile sheath small subunit [Desulfatitalea sp.]
MADSTQDKLKRVRPPRVHITYDVETGDAVEQKEIPFVVGVLSDLSGNPEQPLPPIKERKYVEVDRDNLNEVLKGTKPRLTLKVDNKIEPESDTQLRVELQFNTMDDFHPERIAEQVEPVRKLVEARRKLYNLLAKLDGNDRLEALLQDVITSTDKLAQIAKQEDDGDQPQNSDEPK